MRHIYMFLIHHSFRFTSFIMMDGGSESQEEMRRRLAKELEELQKEEEEKVEKIWAEEERKLEELKRKEEDRVRIVLASARTQAAINVGRALPGSESVLDENERVKNLVESAKSEADMNKALFENSATTDGEGVAKKKSQSLWEQEEEKVKLLKRREEERVRILLASAMTEAAKHVKRASKESEEIVKKKTAEHEATLSLGCS